MPRTPRLPSPAVTAGLIQQRNSARPRLGLVLGSGFGVVGSDPEFQITSRFEFRDLPGFPVGRIPGHAGQFLLGEWHGCPLAVLSGRAHFYEGFDLAETTYPIRVLAELGISELLLTNAAGGIDPDLRPGDFLSLSDHINLIGQNPLRGAAPPGGDYFVDLTEVYDPGLRGRLRQAARRTRQRLREGVYLAVAGPSYETPAEIRAFRSLGADAVGMSTVPEAIVGRQCGLRVAGLSFITNRAAGLGNRRLSHSDVLATAQRGSLGAAALIGAFVAGLGQQGEAGNAARRP
jgi:purine-nucleoside phosphorylase